MTHPAANTTTDEAPENPPAFPIAVPEGFYAAHDGMTMRDWFAGQALVGRMINGFASSADRQIHARVAYEIADAMLATRAQATL